MNEFRLQKLSEVQALMVAKGWDLALPALLATLLVVWQCYWVNNHLTASDFKAKSHSALSRITRQGEDSYFIIVYAPKEQTGGGEVALEAFVSVADPEILSALA